jgi:hypothetical protein
VRWMRCPSGHRAAQSGRRGEEQAETTEAHRELHDMRHAHDAGPVSPGRPVDPLLRQGLPGMHWLLEGFAL